MSVDLNALAPVTDLEQRMLDEAATSGWKFSLEQLRESRRAGPDGLLVAQRLLETGADVSVSGAEELALVDECWRAGGRAGKRSSSRTEGFDRCVDGG